MVQQSITYRVHLDTPLSFSLHVESPVQLLQTEAIKPLSNPFCQGAEIVKERSRRSHLLANRPATLHELAARSPDEPLRPRVPWWVEPATPTEDKKSIQNAEIAH